MTRHLCISVTFLDPLFHGEADSNQPEWPPSPMRLFQALLAAAHTGCRKHDWSDAKAEAFRWLERRDPPEIVAPEARRAASYTLFVPNNDSDRKFDRQERLTSKIVSPHRLFNGQTVHYLWPIAESEWTNPRSREAANMICRAARDILALGWGIDLVVADGKILDAAQARALPGRRWQPGKGPRSPDQRRRVPRQGTLDNLSRVYESFLNSVKGKLVRPREEPRVFDQVCYRKIGAMSSRPCAVFDLRDAHGQWRPFPQAYAVYVAAMVRHQACEAAKRDTHRFDGGAEVYVAGHVGDRDVSPPRFSYLPLPTIRLGPSDGMIRRVLIAEPYGGDGTHAAWASRRLANTSLVTTQQQVTAILTQADPADHVKQFYVNSGRDWATVTPVAMPGYDDGKQTKAEKLFLKAVLQAGLPIEAIQEFTLRKAPFWPGSLHPSLYQRPQDYLKHCPLWHVHVRFQQEIPGPLSIGVGRHCGLGLFARLDTDTAPS